MAKNKDVKGNDIEPVNMEGITPAAPAPPAGTPPPADAMAAMQAELDAARARIAELESASAAPTASGAVPSAAPAQPQRFLVRLKHAASWVVEAVDPANAWEAYKKATGVISADYQPEITPTDLPVGRAAA